MSRSDPEAPREAHRVRYVLVGPTASGKTALSLPLAERLGAEILAVDSRQVFRGMDVGTAKPTPAQRARVPHHLLDLVEVHESMSAGEFGRRARAVLGGLDARGVPALLVAGTGLYLRAVMGGLFEGPPRDAEFRAAMRERIEREGAAGLHAELARVDPGAAARIRPADGVRIVRALEVLHLTGRTLSAHFEAQRPEGREGGRVGSGASRDRQAPGAGASTPIEEFRVIGLDRPREELHRRIEARARAMVAGGMVAETRALLEAGLGVDAPAFRAVGYGELARHLRGQLPLEAATEEMIRATRRYARRQLTWFRRQVEARWIEVSGEALPVSTAAEILLDRNLPYS